MMRPVASVPHRMSLDHLESTEAVAEHRVKREFLINSLVNRVPSVDWRMRLYARMGVQLEDPLNTVILRHTEVYGPEGLRIGTGTNINRHCILDGRGGLTIGRHVAIAERVMVFTGEHDVDDEFRNRYIPVEIGDRVLVNAGSLIVPGVVLGEGALIAGGAVVTRDVDPWTVVAGVPARPIRERRPGQTYELTWRPPWR